MQFSNILDNNRIKNEIFILFLRFGLSIKKKCDFEMHSKKHFICSIVCFCFFSVQLFGQNLQKIAEVDLGQEYFINPIETRTADIATSSKHSVGLYQYAEIDHLFHNFLHPEKMNLYILEAESESGQKVVFSMTEATNTASKIPPMILIKKVKGRTGDTIIIKEKSGKMDYESLEKEAQKFYHFKIITNIKSKDTLNNTLGEMTLFFPQDISTQRTLKKVRKLRLYLIN